MFSVIDTTMDATTGWSSQHIAPPASSTTQVLQQDEKSCKKFPENVDEFLRKEKIVTTDENLEGMYQRVVSSIMKIEEQHDIPERETSAISDTLLELLGEKCFIPQTTTLENASADKAKYLSACSAPSLDLQNGRIDDLYATIREYHVNGMGTGFNLDMTEDPVEMLQTLNRNVNKGYESGSYTRPVGNIALLHYKHPKLMGFIHSKDELSENWKFNISVLLDDEFMAAYLNQSVLKLHDGRRIDPGEVLTEIAKASIKTGDPGVIFADQLNRRNVFSHLYTYNTVAPCGEVGLSPGEVCQFAYVNISRYVNDGDIDLGTLISHLRFIVRFLDNAIDYNLAIRNNIISTSVLEVKRKIGVGVCGWADTLHLLGIDYDSKKATKLAEEVMSAINYHTKLASVDLAKRRGSILDSSILYRMKQVYTNYNDLDNYNDWSFLKKQIENHGIRHSSTTALPPTGRSSMILGVNQQIEPYFSVNPGSRVGENVVLLNKEGKTQTATQLSIDAHLDMAAAFQRHTDEAISKTVSLRSEASIENIIDVIVKAHLKELAGVTVYVNGSRSDQPVGL